MLVLVQAKVTTQQLIGTPQPNEMDDLISYLFARGPRNDAEEAILDEHIKEASERIRNSWTDEERYLRASKAGSPLPEEACTRFVTIFYDSLNLADDNG